VLAAGNGVTVGTVSGNYTSIETTALGRAGPQGSFTDTTAQQVNVGGTIAGGTAANKGWGKGATGISGGSQTTQTEGGATASASNTRLSGSLKLDEPRGNGHGNGHGAR
jgi:hypothetical protein